MKKWNVNYSKLENTIKNERKEFKKENIEFKKWNLSMQQRDIMKRISEYIEIGYGNTETFNLVAKDLDLDIEELFYIIEEIKEHILEASKDKMENTENITKKKRKILKDKYSYKNKSVIFKSLIYFCYYYEN